MKNVIKLFTSASGAENLYLTHTKQKNNINARVVTSKLHTNRRKQQLICPQITSSQYFFNKQTLSHKMLFSNMPIVRINVKYEIHWLFDSCVFKHKKNPLSKFDIYFFKYNNRSQNLNTPITVIHYIRRRYFTEKCNNSERRIKFN